MMTQRQAVQAAPGALEVYAPRLDDLFTRANQVQVPPVGKSAWIARVRVYCQREKRPPASRVA